MPIFYVTIDIEKALGLEKILPNFHIICLEDNEKVQALLDENIKVFCLERYISSFMPYPKTTNQVLAHPLIIDYIKKHSQNPNIMVFKTNEGIEEIANQNEFKLIEVPAYLNKMFEDKITQFEILTSHPEIPLPDIFTVQRLSSTSWDEIVQKCGNNVVVQFSKGNSGKTTYFIKKEQEFLNLQNLYPLRMAKIARKINGTPYTINGCITKFGVVSGGLSEQVTGIDTLTSSEGGTCGNDWMQKDLSQSQRESIIELTNSVGRIMQDKSYKGLFGIDVLVKDESIYLIEINARQIASIPMHTKMQLRDKEMPLELAHILEILDKWDDYVDLQLPSEISQSIEKFKISDLSKTNLEYNQPKPYSQITLRNTSQSAVTVKGQFTSGIYKYGGDNTGRISEDNQNVLKVVNIDEYGDKSLCLLKKAYDISALEEMEGFVITTANRGKTVNSLNEYARMQFPFSIFSDQGKLKSWIIESINTVRRHTLK